MKYFHILAIFFLIFFIYLGVGTKFTFKPKWALDYYNPLAQSLLRGHFDIQAQGTTYDLVYFKDKWYVLWGILPSLLLIPFQLIKGRFIPTIYLSVTLASINVCIIYLLLSRLKKEFFPNLRDYEILLLTALFAFGTTQFYVGTLAGVWHVSQMVTFFFGTLGLYIIFKKKKRLRDYFFSSILFCLALLGRATSALMIALPIFFYGSDYFLLKKVPTKEKIDSLKKGSLIIGFPMIAFLFLFFLYNYLRFQNPFEYGYKYLTEAPHLAELRQKNGIMSLQNIPTNFWYMFLEIPKLTYQNNITLDFNLNGNSIFFLTPPFLAIFLTFPLAKKGNRLNPYIVSLWITAISVMLPNIGYYNTGWMQFGYRYSLDITVVFLILSIFGMKGRLNFLYILGIGFSITMYWMGIQALM